MSFGSKHSEPIGTPEQLQIALDAAIEANRRLAAELSRADALALAAERLLFAHRSGGDLTGPYAALESALASWTAAQLPADGAGE